MRSDWYSIVMDQLPAVVVWVGFSWLSYWLYRRMGQEVDQWAADGGGLWARIALWIRRTEWTCSYLFLSVSFGRAASVLVWWAVRGSTDVDVWWSVAGAWALCAFSMDFVLLGIEFNYIGPRAPVPACVLSLLCTCGLLIVYCRVLALELFDESGDVAARVLHWACYADILLIVLGLAASGFWYRHAGFPADARCNGFGLRTLAWFVYVSLQVGGLAFVSEYHFKLTPASVHSPEMATLRMAADLVMAAAGTVSLCVHAKCLPNPQVPHAHHGHAVLDAHAAGHPPVQPPESPQPPHSPSPSPDPREEYEELKANSP